MELNRAGDVVVGLTMIAIGLSPCGLLLLGQLHPTNLAAGLGIDSTQIGTFLLFIIGLFGLFLAVMGVLTIRNGRSTSDTADLY